MVLRLVTLEIGVVGAVLAPVALPLHELCMRLASCNASCKERARARRNVGGVLVVIGLGEVVVPRRLV